MKNPFFLPFLILLCSVFAGPVLAEKADRGKPMNVEADALRYDDLAQTSVFTGRVVLTKGSIIIRGAQLTARQDPQGNQYGLVTAEPGKLAFFRQKREGLDEFIEGEAGIIEYDGRADTVKLSGQAQLRRYKGAIVNDEMSGGVILYDNRNDVFSIDNGVATGSPSAKGGRVRAMLTPSVEPAATKPAAPASGTASPAALRSTTTLDGERK
jgi:lipopolysaccharide export system protein LptA